MRKSLNFSGDIITNPEQLKYKFIRDYGELFMNPLENIEHIPEKIIPSTDNIINWFNQPKEDARQYLIESIKNDDDLSPQQASSLIFNSRKLVKEYANCKTIFEGAKKKFEKNADTSQIDIDWIAMFFDKARLVNKEDMQIIWSNILAQEVNTPGFVFFIGDDK